VTHLLVFLAALLGDIGWTMYFKEVENDRAARAGCWSAFVVLAGGFSVFQYAHNLWYLADSAVGSFLGVYVTMRYEQIFYSAASSSGPSPGP
jgi:hypothetical protein